MDGNLQHIIIPAKLNTSAPDTNTLTFLILPYSMLSYLRIRKIVNVWKEDAVEIGAWAIEKDRNRINLILRIKISLEFYYNGKKYVKESGEKNDMQQDLIYYAPGYDSVYRKYVNRDIRILYSPKYDQVMILKD